MKNAAPVRRRKLYEEIVERIEDAILSGEYKDGDTLPPERELGEAFGVGRTSIREALFALQRMGLVTISNGERARVSSVTPNALVNELSGVARHLLAQPNGVRYFQQARMLFEVGLAQSAARLADAEDIALLAKLLESNGQAVGDDRRFRETDVAFHLGIADASKNPIFNALHLAVVEWLVEQRTTSLRSNGSAKAAFAAHQRIFAAIERGDAAQAGEAMREHLTEVENHYWQVQRDSKEG